MKAHPPHPDRRAAAQWFTFAVGALMLAGLFSMGLVVGRMPLFSGWVGDPGFFKRCLVVHVDLALLVWFYSFVVAMVHLIGSRSARLSLMAPGLLPALLGVAAMVASAGIPSAEPVLANYVPVVDHPLFVGGLVLFGAGIVSAVLGPRLRCDDEVLGFFEIPSDVAPALRAAAVALLAAALTFYGAWLATPNHLEPAAYYELVAWGGGHVLQVASEAAMIAAWLVLVGSALGRPVLGRRRAAWLMAALVTPHLAMPAFTLAGTTEPLYHLGATRLMQFGIAPVVTLVLFFMIRELICARRSGELRVPFTDPRLVAFAASAALTVVGFVLGAMIRGSNTMVPAHYHAAIGAVTVSFMALGALLLAPERFGVQAPGLLRGNGPAVARWRPSWHRWQPALFGVGQLVFAFGFGVAGAHGMGRKLYGAEQHVRSVGEWLGLGVMGIGGLVAVVGGVLFLAMFVGAAVPVLRRRVLLLERFATSTHIMSPLRGSKGESHELRE